MITLAVPIVRVVYERGAFDRLRLGSLAASCLWHGMFVYWTRCAGAVFYALGMASHRFASVWYILTQCLPMFSANFRRTGFVLATVE